MNDRLLLGFWALIAALLVSLPFWPRPENPAALPAPEALAAGECPAEASLMRAEHGRNLKKRRDSALRAGRPRGAETETYRLDNCLSCHTDRQEFCLRCHARIGVSPDCFNCHFGSPPEKTGPGGSAELRPGKI